MPSLLVRKLEYFPLAIAQAGFFLKVHNTIRGSEYVKYLDDESERSKLLSYATGTENYNRSVTTTWEVSFQKLVQDEKTKPTAKLLTFLGFLDSAGVSIDYLCSAFHNQTGKIRSVDGQNFDFLKDGLDFRLSVDTLAALSLIHVSSVSYGGQEERTLNLHPLVHEWTRVRLNLTPEGPTMRDEMINCNIALALHNYDIGLEWSGLYREASSSLPPQLKYAERTKHSYNTETVILLATALYYGNSTYKRIRRSLIRMAKIPYISTQMSTRETDRESMGVINPGITISPEYYLKISTEFLENPEVLTFLDILDRTLLEGPIKDFGACIIAGLHCVRATVLYLDKNREAYSEFQSSIPRSTSEENHVLNQSTIQNALSKLYEEDTVAQLFKSWNISHHKLPQSQEFLEFYGILISVMFIVCLLYISIVSFGLYICASVGDQTKSLECLLLPLKQ